MPTLHPAQITIPLAPWDIRNRVSRYLDYAKNHVEFENQERSNWAGHFIVMTPPSAPEPFPVVINDANYMTSIFEVTNRYGGFANTAVCYAYTDDGSLPSAFFVIERNQDNHWLPKNSLLAMSWEDFIQLDVGERYTLLLGSS